MSRWVGVVQHDIHSDKRIGETLINLDRVDYISVTENIICFEEYQIKVNKDSMKYLLDIISSLGCCSSALITVSQKTE